MSKLVPIFLLVAVVGSMLAPVASAGPLGPACEQTGDESAGAGCSTLDRALRAQCERAPITAPDFCRDGLRGLGLP